jgi:hypothetical protein
VGEIYSVIFLAYAGVQLKSSLYGLLDSIVWFVTDVLGHHMSIIFSDQDSIDEDMRVGFVGWQ